MYIEYCWYIEYRLRWNLNYWRIVLIQTNRFLISAFVASLYEGDLSKRIIETDNWAYRAWLKIWVFHCNCWTLDSNRQFPFLSGYEFLSIRVREFRRGRTNASWKWRICQRCYHGDLHEYLKLQVKSLSKSNSVINESWNKKEEAYCLCWRYHRKIFLLFLPIFSKIKDAMVFVMSFANIHNASLNESEASHGFKTVQRLCTWNKPLANVLMMFSYVSDHSMTTSFNIHLAISSIHGKISFQFRFWAHFFALQNPDTRFKIFRTALKKFALRAEYYLLTSKFTIFDK